MGLVGSSSFLYLNVDVMVWDGHIISAFAKSSSFPHRQCYLFFFFSNLGCFMVSKLCAGSQPR